MLGIIAEGRFVGGSLEREPDSKAMYIQLTDGRKVPINNNTAVSAQSATDPNVYNGAKTVKITWKNGESSIVLLGVTSLPAQRRNTASSPASNVPAFTPPAASTFTPPVASQAVPTFTPLASTQAVPTFTPPEATQPVPAFTPPTRQNNSQSEFPGVPVPSYTKNKTAAPVFTPPVAPQFTPPPRPRFSGPACHYHPDEPAVRRCARCGKPICQDCADNYQVTNDQYAGKPICYDCCQELVSDNIAQLTENLNKIKVQFGISLVGIIIGFIVGIMAGISAGDFGAALAAGFIYACIGGVFLSAMKAFLSLTWEAIKIAFDGQFGVITIISIIFQVCLIVFKCVWITVSNTIQYIIYIKRTSGFIESDTAFLQQIKDYMEYTQVRNKYQGVDIDTLLENESSLADNSFARMVQSEGEEQAEANLRGVTATINEHGEIIRSFAA